MIEPESPHPGDVVAVITTGGFDSAQGQTAAFRRISG